MIMGVNMSENDEKKEKEEIYKQVSEKVNVDQIAKETIVGRKGHVDEEQVKKPQEFTNNELMTKLEEIVESNAVLLDRFDKTWERIEWLEEFITNGASKKAGPSISTPNEAGVSDKAIRRIGQQIGDCIADVLELRKGK